MTDPQTETAPTVPEVLASMDGQPTLPPDALPTPSAGLAGTTTEAPPAIDGTPTDGASAGPATAEPDAPLPEADPLTSTSAGAEPFTNADGSPGPIVTEAPTSGAGLAVPSTPVLIASVALYREPDGRYSLVREHVPQTFHVLAGDILAQAKQYLHQRMDAHGK